MRCILILSVITGTAWSQGLTDAAGVVAGGSVGVGAGKQVSQGITSALQGVSAATNKAAATQRGKPADLEKPEKAPARPAERAANGGGGGGAVLQTAPGGVVKDHSLVPPPPPKKVAVVPPPPALPVAPAALQPVVVVPPPRQVTPDDLKTVASGTPRAELLKLGAPASRITMFDEGHLLEIYQYQSRQSTFGVVRLNDGAVSSVQMR